MRVRHPRPSLWPMLVIGAVVLAVLAAAVIIAGLPRLGGRPASSPSASPSSSASASAASGQAQPGVVARVPEPAAFGWSSGVWLPPRNAVGPPIGYSLQAGTLADDGPVIDLQVPLVTRNVEEDAGRLAVFSAPVAGAVVYVADDGASSQVSRVTLSAPDAIEPMAELDEVVWAMAVDPDGSHAYLLLVHRDRPGDAGVVRLALDGSGDAAEVLGPARPAGDARTDIVLAAVSGFRASLLLSPDGGHLLRRVCADPAAPCVLDVLDLASGDASRIADYDAFGIADGRIFWTLCEQAGCSIGLTDLESGEEVAIAESGGIAALAELDGKPVVAHSFHSPDGRGSVAVVDPETGVNREVMRGASFEMHSNALDQSLKIVAPPGWIVVRSFEGGGEQLGAVRLGDATTIPLPPVPRVLPPVRDQG